MRPWRLMRRQRVEMEAALFLIRPVTRRYCDASDVLHGASLLTPSDRWEWGVDGMREWRILRARVALALRAALRADEDARCEEATSRMCDREPNGCLCIGAAYGVDLLREWPPMDGGVLATEGETVPLALWEAR